MKNDKISMVTENYEVEQTGESIQGVTVFVNGKFKDVLDKIIMENEKYDNYQSVLMDALLDGVGNIISNRKM